jgi:hypothetical protein
MPFEGSQAAGLTSIHVSEGSGHFLIGQTLQVTDYVLAAYIALVVAPELICKNVAN